MAAAVTAAATASGLPHPARAASFLWDGGGNNDDWSTNNNWSPNGAPSTGATIDTITFGGTVRLTPNLNANRTIASLTFLSNAGGSAFTLNSSTGSTLTIGSGGITQNDGDTVTINHALALGASQTWTAAAGDITANGTLNLAANTLTLSGGSDITLGGAISGTGSITKNSTGALTISGAGTNTYSGTTTVNSGTLNLNKSIANGAIAGNLTIGDDAGTDIVSLLAADQIGQTGNTVTINSSGVLQLNSFADTLNNVVMTGGQITTSTAAGTLNLSGTLSTNAAATTATISGPGTLSLFTNTKTFTIADGAAAVDFEITTAISQDIAGRSITKNGAGTMRLSGAGTYSGGLALSAGTLIINNNAAAGTGPLILSGGTVKSQGGNTLSNAVNLTGSALVESDGGASFLNLGGVVSGTGSLTVDNAASAGAGAVGLVLSGAAANTQSGTINVIDGVLQLGKTAGINAIAGNLIIGDSSTATVLGQVVLLNNDQIANTSAVTVRRSGHLNLANGNRSDTIGALTLEDGLVTTGAGTLTITGALTSTNVTPSAQSTISGNLDLGGATRSVSSGAANTLNLDASVSNGGIAFSGAGTLNLTAANTFAGGFDHGGSGTVNIGNNAAFGTGAVSTAVGATRTFSVTGGAKTLANGFVLNGPAQFTLPASLAINGDISGAGGISKSGLGDLTLGGSGSSYSGVTTITAGKLIITANNALGAISGNTIINPGAVLELSGVNYTAAEPLTINGAGGAAPSLAGTSGASTWTGPITLAGNSVISASGGTLAVTGAINAAGFGLTLDGALTSSYSGNISGGATSLTKLGAGTATISGINSYGGTTAVLVGTLRVAGAGGNAIPDTSPVSIEPGATLEFAGNETIGTIQPGSLGSIVLNPGATATVQAGTFGGVISGSAGTFSKTTASTLSLQGASLNTFAGTTQVLAGTLNLAKGIGDGAIAGSLIIGDSSTSTPTAFVTLNTNDQIANNAAVTIRRSGRLDLATGNRSDTIGALTLEDATLATGAGTLTITGPLTSNNVTPAQVSTINGNLSLGGGTRIVTSGTGNTLNIDAVVSNGGMWVQGDGIVNLNAANTFAGGFEHGSGATIAISNNAALGAGTITTTAGATRVFAVNTSAKTLSNNFLLNGPAHFALAADLTLNASISGAAAMSKDGAGTLTLNGPGTFSGGLSATAGTLVLNNNAAAGAGTITLGAVTFRSDTGGNFANAVNLTGGTIFQNIAIAPGGIVTFSGVVSGSGDFTLANPDGTAATVLRLAGSSPNLQTGTINVIDGTLELAKTGGNAIAGNVIIGDHSTATMTAQLLPLADDQIANGATVTVRRSGLYNLAAGNRSDVIAALNLEDGTVAGGTGQLHILGPINSSNVTPGAVSTISGVIALGGAVRTVTSGTNNTLNLDAVVSNGGILLLGNGTLNLTNGNTFALGFEHGGGGTVNIGNNAAFGTGSVTTSSSATRVFSIVNGAKTISNVFSLNGPVHFALPANLTLTGNIAGAGGISKDGVGDLTLGGLGSNYTGTTTINEGKLIVTADNALGLPSAGTTLAAGVPLELPGVNYTAAEPITINGAGGVNPSLVSTSGASTWAGPITLASPSIISAAGGTLNVTGAINGAGFNVTLDGALSSSYSGSISGGAGTSLFKRGTGSARLSGANSYGGSTNVEAGTLVVANPAGNAIPDASPVVVSPGAVLSFALDETIGDILGGSSAATNLNPGVIASITSGSFGGAITNTNDASPGTLRKVGSGTLTLSGANTFGSLVINGGTLRVQAGAAIADSTPVSLANVSGAIFEVSTAETIGGLSGGGASGGNVTFGPGAILTVTGGGTYSGTISGAGALTKGSGADLFLRGTNSFSGRTTINTGVLDILAESSLGAVPPSFVADQINLDNGGTLRLADGTVTIPINRGITIGGNGGRFMAGNADTLTLASRLTGAGTVTFAGVGTPSTMPVFALNGSNTTFTGKTVINDAIVTIANDANLSAAPVSFVADKLTLLDGGTLRVTATMSIPANRGVTLQNGANALGGAFDVNSAQTLTTLSPITGLGTFTKRGAGTLNLSNTIHTYAGKTIIDAGTVIAQQDSNFGSPPLALVADQITLNAVTLRWTANGPGLNVNRGVRLGSSSSQISVDAGITMAINGPVSGTGGLTKTGPGTLNLLGTNTYAAATSVGAGRVILNRSFSTNTSIAISAGATLELAQAPAVTVKTSAVVATGKFDVKDDKLIITAQPVGTFNGTAYSGVTAMITSAYAFGAWSGNGLTTTMPDAQAGLTTLAVASADQLGIDTFGGMSVAPSNVLVMYTYAGDANLDGTIDGGDYGIIDNFIQIPSASGYANGDFNYDGAIDGGDYGIIDNNIQAQGAPFPPSGSIGSSGVSGVSGVAGAIGITGVTAVPEPSACGFAFLAAATLLGRRRRRRDPRLW